jgi:uncharacterized membrane protein YhaH (DUF805 family)
MLKMQCSLAMSKRCQHYTRTDGEPPQPAAFFGAFLAVGLVAATVPPLAGLLGFALVAAFVALLIPSSAVMVRRLHDTGRSGAWWLISFIPFSGIVLLVFTLLRGDPWSNRYGPPPTE